MASTNGEAAPARKLKILMLHGFTQSGQLFDLKTKALQKTLAKHFPPAPKPGHLADYPGGIEFSFPTAPIRLDPPDVVPGPSAAAAASSDDPDASRDVDAYGWWRRRGACEPYTYEGLERGFEEIAAVLRDDGPFDGVIGFSQGGAAAGMLASLLEPARRQAFEAAQSRGGMRYPESFVRETGYVEEGVHAPLKFAVSYSGFGARNNALYQAFYEPKIETPMLHFIGSMDTVVSEERSLRLVDACVDGRGEVGRVPKVAYHPGGHFLPSSQKQYVNHLVMFMRGVLGEGAGR